MHRTNIILILILVLLLSACSTKKRPVVGNDSPTIESPYFGQKLPGLIPEIFAPGIVSLDGIYEGGVTFSPELDEMYFSPAINGHSYIYFSKLKNKKWTTPKKANFTKGTISDEFAPFVSHNGKRIYFATYDSIAPLKIWYVNRLKDSWSDAIRLDSPINNDEVVKPVAAKNGDLFYVNSSKKKMYYAPYKNGKFPKVHEVGIAYGSLGFISPSQDYMIVQAHKENDKTKDMDLFVCFKKKDGTWSTPINLGDAVNTNFREGNPTMTPDGKYLFFNRYVINGKRGLPNVYWVSTEIIHTLKTAYFKKEY